MERELLLLGLLHSQDMHGYKLAEFVERDLAICTDLKKPTAYYVLDKMAQKGWVTSTETQEGNRPPRQVYGITPEGEQVFQNLLRESLASYNTTKFGDDIALAFAEGLPTDELLTLLNQKRAALLADLETMRATPPHPGFIQLVIDHRLFHLESELRWLDQLRLHFESKSN